MTISAMARHYFAGILGDDFTVIAQKLHPKGRLDVLIYDVKPNFYLPTGYVRREVIQWLNGELDGVISGQRDGFYQAYGRSWALYRSEHGRGDRVSHSNCADLFAFKRPSDALRFKLTWL